MTTSPNDADRWAETDYDAALEVASSLMDAPAGSQAERRLDTVVTQIEHYEKEHYPMDLPAQVECAKCSLIVTLYAPVSKSDGSRELVCLSCLLELRRSGWPPAYETKIAVPGEFKGAVRIE